jgi:hypothetical protein
VRPPIAIYLLALSVAAGGCGTDADADTARTVTTRFLSAVGSGDGATACEQLSPNARAELEKEQQRECREAVTGLKVEPGSVVRGVQVYSLNALVDLSSGESAFLEKGSQGWRLDAVGCRPQKGKPSDVPYDCQLQS